MIPERVYPVVDLVNDNLGSGVLIRSGGVDMLIDERDLGEDTVGW